MFAERRREQLIGCAHLNRTNAIVLVNSKTRSEAVIVNLATRREVCGFVLHYAADRTPWTPRQGWTKVWLTQLSHTSGHVDIDLLDALDESVKRVANLENRGDFRQWLMLELLDLDSTAVSALVTFRYFIWEVSVIVKLRKLEPDPR